MADDNKVIELVSQKLEKDTSTRSAAIRRNDLPILELTRTLIAVRRNRPSANVYNPEVIGAALRCYLMTYLPEEEKQRLVESGVLDPEA